MEDYPLTHIEEAFFQAAGNRMPGLLPQRWVGPYRVDFLIPERRLVIECDGHEYHSSREARTKDALRERELQKLGYTVIRFTGTEIHKDVEKCVHDAVILMNRQAEFAPETPVGIKFCVRMQGTIMRLVEKHGINFNESNFFIRLDMGEPWIPLSVERHGNRITVSHYSKWGPDIAPDPSMNFAITHLNSDFEEWVALNMAQILGNTYAADYIEEEEAIRLHDEEAFYELAEFAERWARGIEAQGWLEADVTILEKETWGFDD